MFIAILNFVLHSVKERVNTEYRATVVTATAAYAGPQVRARTPDTRDSSRMVGTTLNTRAESTKLMAREPRSEKTFMF